VLSKLSKFLNLSQTFAGVTLLAFANGAPDIIASASASGAEGGLEIAVGGLFGACIFGSNVVIGYCLLKSKNDVTMPKAEWIRDICFYLLATVIILIYGIVGFVNVWMGIGFICFYFVYLGVVILQLRNGQVESPE